MPWNAVAIVAVALCGQNPEPGGAKSFAIRFGHDVLVDGLPTRLEITALDATGVRMESFSRDADLEGVYRLERQAEGRRFFQISSVTFVDGRAVLENVHVRPGVPVLVSLGKGDARVSKAEDRLVLPGVVMLLPPLIAILLAVLTRQVLLALFCGVWVGVTILSGWNPFAAFLTSFDTYIIGSLADTDNAYIVLFSLTLAGLIGIIQSIGGIHGLVDLISRFARGARSGQIATWFLGILIFFDDYANSLIVGTTMRPFTDRVRISREKLSFIVDSTAAPVATIGIISTWTAYQVGVVKEVLPDLAAGESSPYFFFLNSIPYSFYSILMLFLVFLAAISLRDVGPMIRAERRCRETGAVLRSGAQPLVDPTIEQVATASGATPHWINAALPIACLIGATMAGLYRTGVENAQAEGLELHFRNIMGHADSFKALLWASVSACVVAASLGLCQGYKMERLISSWVEGVRSLILAIMVLILAWSIASVCKDLRTGDAVAWMVPDALPAQIIPAVTFVVAGLIAFATGTSYGTMGILIPIVLPLSYTLAQGAGLNPEMIDVLGFATLSAVLGGAVFGDHCSPISDTTVLSSMASGADHIDHVRTQLPYALLAAAVSLPAYILVGYGWTLNGVIPAAALVLAIVFWLISRSSRPGG